MVESIVEFLYGAALGQGNWSEFAPLLARAFGSASAQVSLWNTRSVTERLSTTDNYTYETNEAYKEYYYKIDQWVKFARAVPVGKISITNELIQDDVFFNTEHYNDYCRPLGISYCMGLVMPLGDGQFASIGVHRPRSRPFESATHRGRLARLVPDIRRALQIRQKLIAAEATRTSALFAVDHIAFGVIAVASDMSVVFLNKAADAILSAPSSGIAVRSGRLTVRQLKSADVLAAAVRRATTRASTAALACSDLHLPRPEPMRPLWLQVLSPERASVLADGKTAAIIFIHESQGGLEASRGERTLRTLYGLTSAEAKLALAIISGERLREFAERSNVSQNTAKTQLKHIFWKTECTSQMELARLLSPLHRVR